MIHILIFYLASHLYSVSQNGRNIARLRGNEVVIHGAPPRPSDLGITQKIRLKEPFASQVKFLRFSRHDGNALIAVSCLRVLCASDTRASVWQINSPDCYAEIENIDPSLINLDFGSNDNEILVFHHWNTKVTIFNLHSGRSQIIRSPKFATVNGYGYRPRTGQFAILLKPETVDLLTIHEFQTYELISKVVLPTVDAHGLKWSPDGKWIAVWEGESAGTKVLIYTADGQLFRTYTGPQGSDTTSDLGVRNIEWSPSIGGNPTASLLAVGKFDGTVDILNGKTVCRESPSP
jgi:WD40 repeat protein